MERCGTQATSAPPASTVRAMHQTARTPSASSSTADLVDHVIDAYARDAKATMAVLQNVSSLGGLRVAQKGGQESLAADLKTVGTRSKEPSEEASRTPLQAKELLKTTDLTPPPCSRRRRRKGPEQWPVGEQSAVKSACSTSDQGMNSRPVPVDCAGEQGVGLPPKSPQEQTRAAEVAVTPLRRLRRKQSSPGRSPECLAKRARLVPAAPCEGQSDPTGEQVSAATPPRQARRQGNQLRGLSLVHVPLTLMTGTGAAEDLDVGANQAVPAEIPSTAPRRSKRQCMRPLQAWRNERLVYERPSGSIVPSVCGVILNAAGEGEGLAAAPELKALEDVKATRAAC